MAPYAVMQGLLANLKAGRPARVINTSTSGVDYVKDFEPGALAHPQEKFKKLFGAYSDSKLALTLWTKAMGAELSMRHIPIVSVDPGANKTQMTAGSGMPGLLLLPGKLFFKPASHGAGLMFDAATGPYASGDFVAAGKVRERPSEGKARRVLEIVRRDAFPA